MGEKAQNISYKKIRFQNRSLRIKMTVEFDGHNGSFDSMDTALQEYL